MNILKGIIIGIAKIIPGLSGTVLMISFNLYDKAINAITRFFDNPKRNFFFLLKLFIGVVIGVVMFSRAISYFINNYYVYTIALFIGLIFGGIKFVFKEVGKKKNRYFLIGLSFIIMFFLSISNTVNIYQVKNNFLDFFVFLLAGILEAIGTILPGVSSTALLMIIGIYPYYIDILGNLINVSYLLESLYFLIPFFIGLVGGIIAISLLVSYVMQYYKEEAFSIILGLSLSSLATLMIDVLTNISNFYCLIFVLVLMLFGYFFASIFNK